MVLEILGSRLIGPHFGASLFVWTALITVTLVALALGYWVGGGVADRRPRSGVFFGILVAAGAAVAIIPLLRRPAIELSWHLGLRLGSLSAATLLFFPPLFLLGMISPFAVRLEARGVAGIGRSAGRLYALSTAGSVAGSILSGFVLVPSLPLPAILWGLALFLVGSGLPAWNYSRKGRRRAGAAVVLILVLATAGALRDGERPPALVDHVPSAYGDLRVVEKGRARSLVSNGMIQTMVELPGLRSRLVYTYAIASGIALCRPEARSALVVGLGGGVLPLMLEEQGMETETVEIDPAVVELARTYFGFPRGKQVQLGDGRVFLERTVRRYDLLVIDAFSGERVPESLLSLEGLQAARRALVDGGVLAINFIGFGEAGPTPGARAVHATLEAVFPHTLVVPAGVLHAEGSAGLVNLVFFASGSPMAPARNSIDLPTFPDGKVRAFHWRPGYPMKQEPLGACILRDDFNRLAFLELSTHEGLRRNVHDNLPGVIAEALWRE